MQVRSGGIFRVLLPGVLLLAAGCGSDRSGDSFSVNPPVPMVVVGERLSLSALPLEELSGEIEWEVMEPNGGALLHSQGRTVTYIAPGAAGTYHLRLRGTKVGGGGVRQDQTITVRPVAHLEPASISVPRGGSVQFAFRQRGLARSGVIWSVEEGEGGTVSSEGLYQAPAARGTYHVFATSFEDKSVAVSATVTVQ